MRGAVGFAVAWGALGTVGLVAALLAGAPAGATVDAYLLLLGALASLALARIGRGARPPESAFERARVRRPVPDVRPEELERLERQLYLGVSGALDGERLRVLLREVAEHRLWERRGVELALQPDAARDALGDAAFDLVRDERRDVAAPFAPGLPLPAIRETIEACERL